MSRSVLTIDGSNVHDFESFIQEFNRVYSHFGVLWNGNLDAFNDYLVWPDQRYELVWKDSDLSHARLGHGEMVKWLEERVQHCHPSNVLHMRERLEAAKLRRGPTMFDKLLEIVERHGDYVQLRLE